ncbi:MAG: hypothetical protein LUE65_11795 [Clostridiales bacterium]|nr:hypothetical protein [Clostridiales bacterium]
MYEKVKNRRNEEQDFPDRSLGGFAADNQAEINQGKAGNLSEMPAFSFHEKVIFIYCYIHEKHLPVCRIWVMMKMVILKPHRGGLIVDGTERPFNKR